mmetsp:Transcript_16800/g.18706  ORF Transcript_16800/g.18706 Transcript_16800/m.18706 type:complete len:123 (+) Transcript_16800:442-810(+)
MLTTFFIFITAIGNPIFEEFYWRVFTLETLADDGDIDTFRNKLITSVAYGAYHFWIPFTADGPIAGIIFAAVTILFGYLLVWQRVKAGIFNAWLIHTGLNIGQIFMMYYLNIISITVERVQY